MRRDRYKFANLVQREAGIQPWIPRRRSLTMEYCRTYVQRFFKCAEENPAWRGNQPLSPFFEQHLRTMERDIVEATTKAKKLLSAKHRWPNISKAELEMIHKLQELDVGYNIADKNYGSVVYSKQLFKEQCLLHLEDEKGTYRKIVNRTKEDILEDIFFRLRLILLRFKRLGGSLG